MRSCNPGVAVADLIAFWTGGPIEVEVEFTVEELVTGVANVTGSKGS